MQNLRQLIKEPLLLFDFETDGLNLHFSRPWQTSWLLIDKGKIESEKDRFPWFDDIKVSAEAARVNGFKPEVYKRKSSDKLKVLNEFEHDMKDRWLVGHNIINFDIYMINSLRRSCGVKQGFEFMDRLIDTRALALAYQLGHTKIDYENFTAWQYSMIASYKKQKGLKSTLEFLLKEFSIPYDKDRLHDGLYDIQMNFEVLKKIVYKFD